MKFLEFIARIISKNENLIIQCHNQENHKIHIIPSQKHENHENVINSRRNHENYEIHIIPLQKN